MKWWHFSIPLHWMMYFVSCDIEMRASFSFIGCSLSWVLEQFRVFDNSPDVSLIFGSTGISRIIFGSINFLKFISRIPKSFIRFLNLIIMKRVMKKFSNNSISKHFWAKLFTKGLSFKYVGSIPQCLLFSSIPSQSGLSFGFSAVICWRRSRRFSNFSFK